MQLNIGHLNEEGIYNGQFTTFALAGKVRAQVRPTRCLEGARMIWGVSRGRVWVSTGKGTGSCAAVAAAAVWA